MTTTRFRPENHRLLVVGLPVGIAALAVFLGLPRAVELRRLNDQTAALRRELAAMPPLPATPPPTDAGAAAASRDEQLLFLEDLTRVMKKGPVLLLSLRPPTSPAASPEARAEGGSPLLLPRVTEITVEGTYGALIAFFHELKQTRRVLATERLHVTATRYPRLAATFRLSRYVVRDAPSIR